MHFGKNFILLLCLTMSSSLQLGDECYLKRSIYDGKCQNLLECDYFLTTRLTPSEYCDEAKSLVCCPSLTFENGKCFDVLSGVYGKCQNLLECNYYALNYRKKPQFCTDGTVCCPPVQLRLSDKMCLEYHTSGVQANNVTASKKASRKPSHKAAIGFTDKNNEILWRCGGSIISPFFILSGARCHSILKFGPLAQWVRIQDLHRLDRFKDTEDLIYKVFRVVETYIHPDYTRDIHYNDIALLKLEEAIVFGDDYQPACLNTATNVPEIMEETDWVLNGTIPYLQRELKVIEYKTCAIWNGAEIWTSGIIDEIQICATDVSENDDCPFDFESRNDLQYKIEGLGNVRGHHVVVGVGSGTVCGLVVFTRVSGYLDWIEEIVWKDEIETEIVTFVFTN